MAVVRAEEATAAEATGVVVTALAMAVALTGRGDPAGEVVAREGVARALAMVVHSVATRVVAAREAEVTAEGAMEVATAVAAMVVAMAVVETVAAATAVAMAR